MTRIKTIKILVILICIISLSGIKYAQAEILQPQSLIILNKESLTLGDIFKNVEENSGYVLAPAPKIGEQLILTKYDIQRIANSFNINWQADENFKNIVVKTKQQKQTHIIQKKDIVAKIKSALSKKMLGSKYDVIIPNRYNEIKLEFTNKPNISVENIRFDNKTSIFKADIALTDNNKTRTLNIVGNAYQLIKIPVVTTRLGKGDIITKEDIKYISVRAKTIPNNTILTANKLIGKTPRRFIEALKYVQPEDIRTPFIIKKGDRVSISIKRGALNLSTIGKALDNASKGNVIRVMNLSSNKIIEGIAIAPQEVIIK